MFCRKFIRQKQLQIELNHVVVHTNIQYYPHSDIISLITFNTTLPALSNADLLDIVPVQTMWS